MTESEQLAAIQDYVFMIFNDDASGHDFHHMERVALWSEEIARNENADPFICQAAGWIHDVGDQKLFSAPDKTIQELDEFLISIHLTGDRFEQIKQAVRDVSFSKGVTPFSLEGKIVQDADRLDAIGAVGIARTFAYGGFNEQLIWHSCYDHQKNTSIQHFYDKLLTLKNSMNTETAAYIASERHMFMEQFLNQFFREWQQ